MSKPILAFIRSSFFCSLLISTSSIAMYQQEDELVSKVTQVSLRYPVPPTVALDDYVNTLCLPGGRIGRWGDSSGNLASWLQATANKKRIEDADGKAIEDLPLFQATLNPTVEGTKLRCDYSLPAADSDLSKGPSTFSLFCEAIPEEIEEVKKLKPESVTEYTTRLLQWQEMLKKRQQFSRGVISRLLNVKLIPDTVKFTNTFTLTTKFEDVREETNFIYFNFDSSTMQVKAVITNAAIKEYEPPIEELS